MAACLQCGKKGLFVKVNLNGICNACQKENDEAVRREENEGRQREAEAKRLEEEARRIAEETKLREEQEEKRKEEERQKSILRASGFKFAPWTEDWTLRYNYEEVDIFTPPDTCPDFSPLKILDSIEVALEPDNDYDEKAVVIRRINGSIRLGYLYRGKLQDMANDFLKRGDRVDARLKMIDKHDKKIQIDLGFYKAKTKEELSAELKRIFKLTGNTNADMQEAISWFCSVGDTVDIKYDYGKEKYLVSCDGSEIGYLPKSAESIAESVSEGVAVEVEENDSGKLYVKIML